MSIYGIKARYYTRQAWMMLGKAREAKFRGIVELRCTSEKTNVAHYARMARMSMQTAVIYRQMDGRI